MSMSDEELLTKKEEVMVPDTPATFANRLNNKLGPKRDVRQSLPPLIQTCNDFLWMKGVYS